MTSRMKSGKAHQGERNIEKIERERKNETLHLTYSSSPLAHTPLIYMRRRERERGEKKKERGRERESLSI